MQATGENYSVALRKEIIDGMKRIENKEKIEEAAEEIHHEKLCSINPEVILHETTNDGKTQNYISHK